MKQILYLCIITSLALSNTNAMNNNLSQKDIPLDNPSLFLDEPLCLDVECNCSQEYDFLSMTRLPADSNITHEKIHDYGRQMVQKLAPKHKASDSHRVTTHQKAKTVAHNMCSMLCSQLTKSKMATVEKEKIDYILKSALSKIIPSSKAPAAESLVSLVDTCIDTVFKNSSTNINDIPTIMRKEFMTRRALIISDLKSLMEKRGKDYINQNEVETVVQKTYEAFIQRMGYVLQSEWIDAVIINLKNDDLSKTQSSYLIPNHGSNRLKEKHKFLHKINKK